MIEVSSEQSRSQLYIHTERCCRCCSFFVCSYTAVVAAAAAVLLLAAAVRRRVPDGQICCCFIESDPSDVFLKRDLFFMVPLGSTVSHVRPRFAYSYTSSIIRHAQNQAGVSPPRPNPPCTK